MAGSVEKAQFRLKNTELSRGAHLSMAMMSKLVIIGFVLVGVLISEEMGDFFFKLQSWIKGNLDWYYVLAMCSFMFFVLWLTVSKYGSIKLGRDDDEPEFSTFAWFSMLFGAGMGVGLLAWSVAEPISHFVENPFLSPGEERTVEAANQSIQLVFLHWGLHGWAVYAIVGMVLAYFSYRKGLPLTIRASLFPIMGDRIYGGWGHAVDLLAVFGTVLGVATTLGVGSGQILAGLNYLFGTPEEAWIKYTIIMVVCVIATLSAVSGVGKGIKLLSELNLWLSIALLVIFLLLGPTLFLLGFFMSNLGGYIGSFIPMGFWVETDPAGQWQGWWTLVYWGWWISWAPFVGTFIARVSRGRTIREFCTGVLVIPTVVTLFWMVVFGGTAMHQELWGAGGIVDALGKDVSRPLYVTIENFNIGIFAKFIGFICIVLVATYFVTSSDSGTLVVATLISMGKENPPISYRIFWGLGIGVVAVVLLASGGLKSLQAASLVAGLPFSMIMFMMMWGLVRSLSYEPSIRIQSPVVSS